MKLQHSTVMHLNCLPFYNLQQQGTRRTIRWCVGFGCHRRRWFGLGASGVTRAREAEAHEGSKFVTPYRTPEAWWGQHLPQDLRLWWMLVTLVYWCDSSSNFIHVYWKINHFSLLVLPADERINSTVMTMKPKTFDSFVAKASSLFTCSLHTCHGCGIGAHLHYKLVLLLSFCHSDEEEDGWERCILVFPTFTPKIAFQWLELPFLIWNIQGWNRNLQAGCSAQDC